MKPFYNIIALAFIIVCSLSCNKKSIEKDVRIHNGINPQILNIIDSMQIDFNKFPFVTIDFLSRNDSDYVYFINSILIPISEDYTTANYLKKYTGYKIIDSIKCLLFLNNVDETTFSNFVKKDSLSTDEKDFEYFKKKYDIYKYKKNGNLKEKIFYINKDDSLVFLKENDI